MSFSDPVHSEYWFVFQHDQLLLIEQQHKFELLNSARIAGLRDQFIREFCLAKTNQFTAFCAELSPNYTLPDNLVCISLRKALDSLHHDYYALIARASSIITWDKNHQFCGRCGHRTEPTLVKFERKCSACSLTFYPRISPSIIVAIQRGDEILMARSAHFPPGAYGLIAGFVEAGESIEEAIHREVAEEVGIKIHQLQYFASQAWPFPDSLMIGFTAQYLSGNLVINHDEIEDAGWYRYDLLPGRPSSKISIGSSLIDYIIAQRSSHGTL